jgi:hypothetical protein
LHVKLNSGLPHETLRIAAQTLNYLESNSHPVIHPGDAFLSSFTKDETIEPILDTITQTHLEEEQIEDLREVVDVEDEDVEVQDDVQEKRLDAQMMDASMKSDRERRKMEKVKAKAEKDLEKERKRLERETLKVEREKEKADRKMRAVVAKLRPMEFSSADA